MTRGTSGARRHPFIAHALALVFTAALAAACDREPRPATPGDTTTALTTPEPPATTATTTPPLATALPVPAFLSGACLRGDPATGTRWSVEQLEHSAVPLRARAIAELSARDSARWVARIARAVDALPSDTTIGDFRGLPVVVVEAWRIVVKAGDTVLVAHVVRRLPMESNPLEESFTLVAVPGIRQGVRDPLLDRWSARDVSREEGGATREFVDALLESDGRLSLLFVREGSVDAGARELELVVRRDDTWRLEWSGPIATCR